MWVLIECGLAVGGWVLIECVRVIKVKCAACMIVCTRVLIECVCMLFFITPWGLCACADRVYVSDCDPCVRARPAS